MPYTNFQVNRTNLSETSYCSIPDYDGIELENEVVLKVDKFALTANNITYGVAGDMIGYW